MAFAKPWAESPMPWGKRGRREKRGREGREGGRGKGGEGIVTCYGHSGV